MILLRYLKLSNDYLLNKNLTFYFELATRCGNMPLSNQPQEYWAKTVILLFKNNYLHVDIKRLIERRFLVNFFHKNIDIFTHYALHLNRVNI